VAGDVFSIGWRSAGDGSGEDNIITGGKRGPYDDPTVACIRSSGAGCLSFRDLTGSEGTRTEVVAVMASGRIVVGGDFFGGIMRLEINGEVDTAFSPPSTLGTGMVNSIVQTGSKILVGGGFAGRIKRLTESGSEDTTFTPPSLNGDVYAIAVQGDGKILVGGGFAGKVKRLNNPSQDSSRSGTILGGGGGSSNTMWIIVIAAAGAAVVGGGVTAARRRKPAAQ